MCQILDLTKATGRSTKFTENNIRVFLSLMCQKSIKELSLQLIIDMKLSKVGTGIFFIAQFIFFDNFKLAVKCDKLQVNIYRHSAVLKLIIFFRLRSPEVRSLKYMGKEMERIFNKS
jgi:hypothetical protein